MPTDDLSKQPARSRQPLRRVARAGRALMAATLSVALGLGAVARPAIADEPPVVLDQEALSDQLFDSLLQIHDGGKEGLAHMLLSAELIEWRRQNPSASPQEVTTHLTEREQALGHAVTAQDQVLPEPDFAIRVVNVLLATPPSNVASAPLIRSFLDKVLGRSVAAFDMREDLAEGALRTAQWLRGKGDGEREIWSAVRRRALADEGFAQAWNTVIGVPLSLDAKAPLEQLKSEPTLNTYVNIDAILAHRGSQAEFLGEVGNQFAFVYGKLLQESEQARERAVQLNAVCSVNPVPSTCTPEKKAEATETAKEEQKDIDGAAAAAKLLGGIVSLTADKSTGEKMQKLAGATFSIVSEINKYAEAIGSRGLEETILSAATLTMSGNIFGAVATLVDLFGSGGGPNLEKQILEQVGELRKEVKDLHKDMKDSFKRIDDRLNTIYDKMTAEFDKLEAGVAGNAAALTQIQNRLAEQNLRLEEVAATILTAIGQEELHDARADVTRYIGYLESYGHPIPSADEYTAPESEFLFVASQASKDDAFVVSPALANNPVVDKLAILNENGEAKALNYLARLATFRDPRVPDPSDLVSNPTVWNFAAQAYTLLSLQNPGYASGVNSSHTTQIVIEGQRILDLARSFSRPLANPDPNGSRTNPVFTSLVQEYRSAVGRFSTAAAGVRAARIVMREEPDGHKPRSYDLFGPVAQAVPPSQLPPDAPVLALCNPGPANPQIARPSNVSAGSLPPEYQFALAAYAPTLAQTDQLPGLSYCYDANWVNVTTVVRTNTRETWGSLQLSMHTRFHWAPSDPLGFRDARVTTYTWPRMEIAQQCRNWRCSEEFSIDVLDALVDMWPSESISFVQGAGSAVAPGLLAEVQYVMAVFLQGRQRALYATLGNELQNVASPLALAVRDMNTAARQLQAYTRLGFPIALASDDVLSGLLFSERSIPVNMLDNPQLGTTFGLATESYACSPVTDPASGALCFGGPFYPLRDQPLLDTAGDVNQPVVCGIPTAGVPGLAGDVVDDCLIAATQQRLNALTDRYRQHSQALADGVYVESLPWISSTLATLPLVNTLVHTPLPN
jgi:hypothetical protein